MSTPTDNIVFRLPLIEVSGSGALAVILATLVVLVLVLGFFFLSQQRAAFITKVARAGLLAVRHFRGKVAHAHPAPSIVPEADRSAETKKLEIQRATSVANDQNA
jgi:hypothetical protein